MKTTQDAKKLFRECGTCSQTFGHLLNRKFGYPKETEERALDPLAGGIMNTGHQCGMLCNRSSTQISHWLSNQRRGFDYLGNLKSK